MRVFHFIDRPLTVEQLRSGGQAMNHGGTWTAAFLGQMLQKTEFELAFAAFGSTRQVQTSGAPGIRSFLIPHRACLARSLRMCCDVVREWRPDLIHFHGTESAYGLLAARKMVACPAVISLQGLLGPCSEWYRYFGNRSLTDIVRMHRWLEIPAMRGQLMGFLRFRKKARREREIILGSRFFIGRTAWDRAYLRAQNPRAHYYHGGEVIREAFRLNRWQIGKARRHRVIFTNSGHPRKGTETLVEAVQLVRPQFPDIRAAIGGSISRRSGYGRYLRRRISELDGAVIELGQLDSEQMAQELLASHVFVSPSFIDNSPNAVCEAQLLGMPVVSTYTGGVPSLIEEGRTGLFFPTGDAPMLAARLRELFEDDALAVQLGEEARAVALRRHDPDQVVRDVVAIYEDVLRRAAG